ncbi:MAG: WG repeat-containing protein [Bacteroidales bacterium]|nr:WG repeat-containing protein [Bacteroidales bacterium]
MKEKENNKTEKQEMTENEAQVEVPQTSNESSTNEDAPVKKKSTFLRWLLFLIIAGGVAFGVTKIVKHHQNKHAYDYYDDYEYEPSDEIISYKNNIMNIVNPLTQKVIVKDIDWYCGYESRKDTIVLFAKNGKRGYCNVVTDKVIVEPTTYTKAWIFSEGLAAVEKDGYIGFINTNGKVAIDFRFPYRGNPLSEFVFHNGHCVVADSANKIGVIDSKGNWIIKPLYDHVEATKDYAIVYTKGDFKKQIDYTGQILNEGIIDYINDIYYDVTYTDLTTGEPKEGQEKNSNFFEYRVEGYSGLMNNRGQFITAPIYTDISGISPTLFEATLQDYSSVVIIDQNGNVISGIKSGNK